MFLYFPKVLLQFGHVDDPPGHLDCPVAIVTQDTMMQPRKWRGISPNPDRFELQIPSPREPRP